MKKGEKKTKKSNDDLAIISTKMLEDYKFIDQIRKGTSKEKEAAFGAIYKKYKDALKFKLMIACKSKETAEDLVAETFSKAFMRLDQYDKKVGAFSTWLFKIGNNVFIDFIRKENKMIINSVEDSVPIQLHELERVAVLPKELRTTETPLAILQVEDMKKHLNEALDNCFSRRHSNLGDFLRKRYLEDMKYEDISECFEVPLSTVKTNIFRAKKMLGEYIKDNCPQLLEFVN